MIVVMLASHTIPRVYKAETKFQRLNDPALQQMKDRTANRNLDPIRRALTEDLKGRASVEQIVDDLGLTRNMAHTPDGQLTREGQMRKLDMVKQIQSRIKVWFTIKSSQVDQIIVSFTHEDRELAPKLVNQLVENYIRRTRQQLDDMLLNSKSFFDHEVERYRQSMSELEAKKLRFEMDHPGLLPEDPVNNQNKLVTLRSQLEATRQQLKVSQERHAALKVWIDAQPLFTEQQRMGQNPMLTDLLDRLNELETELEKHLHQWGRTDVHPLVIKTRNRLADIENKISTTDVEAVIGRDRMPNQARLTAEQQLQMLTGTMVAYGRQLQESAVQIEQLEVINRNFFVVRSDYVKLQREYDEAVSQLEFWENNLRQTTIALRAEVGQRGVRLSILQRAPDQAKPSEPTLIRILMAALILGFGTAGGIICVAEMVDHSFRSVEHAVDDLKLPVLGTVNEIVTDRELAQRRMWNFGIYPTVSVLMVIVLLVSMTIMYVSLEQPHRFEQWFGKSHRVDTSGISRVP
jgi:uncharacterized protein involved in exopolysaccharide biosynthesis